MAKRPAELLQGHARHAHPEDPGARAPTRSRRVRPDCADHARGTFSVEARLPVSGAAPARAGRVHHIGLERHRRRAAGDSTTSSTSAGRKRLVVEQRNWARIVSRRRAGARGRK
jgi:hypothetical protein